MNITDSIAKQIGGKVEKIIKNNTEIQFYANNNIHEYQWRDSRFETTKDVWKNPSADTRQELINIFINHLNVCKNVEIKTYKNREGRVFNSLLRLRYNNNR